MLAKSKIKKSNQAKGTEPFKGYKFLVENNFKESAEQIIEIINTDPEEVTFDLRLSTESLQDFVSFCESYHYFKNQALLSMNSDGYLSADWHLSNKTIVNIVFYGNRKILVIITSSIDCYVKRIKIRSLPSVLKRLKVPSE